MTETPAKSAYQRITRAQRKFVDMLVGGATGSAAVRKLKPHAKRPDSLAWKWKNTQLVREALDEQSAIAMEEAGITNARILLEIAEMGRVSMRSLVWQEGEKEGVKAGTPKKIHELDEITARCIQSIDLTADGEFKVRFTDKLAAKKLLGQYKRLFTESHEINLGEKTLEQLVEASWNRPKPPGDDTPPAAGL